MVILKYLNNILHARIHILIAVSGGLDSMVLLDILQHTNLYISVIHANFQLRINDSNKDESFIRNFCIHKKIPFYSKKFNIKYNKEKSIQMNARNLRYSWFFKILKEIDAKYIVLAHHLDDTIETFFINFFRSSSLKGLVSIPEWSKFLLRPLLSINKSNILQYANYNNIWWREDISNKNFKYLRNSIRNDLTPQFYIKNSKTFFLLKYEYFFIQKSISNIFTILTINFVKKNFCWEMNINRFKNLNPFKVYLYKLFNPYGFYKFFNIKKLLYTSSGKQIFSKKYKLLNYRNRLILNTKKNKKIALLTLHFEINDFMDQKAFISIDFNTISWPIFFKKCKKKDILSYSLNKKKISKFFKDYKLNSFEKEEILMLMNIDDSIIWIINIGLNLFFRITLKTNFIINIY